MTTEQMDAIDDYANEHRTRQIAFDVWCQGLGLSVGEWDRLWAHERTHITDLWDQILCAIAGNFVALEADTNPPAPQCLIDVARRRADGRVLAERLPEMFDCDGTSGVKILETIERYDAKMHRDLVHLQDEVERLTEELAAASTVEVDRDGMGLLQVRYPDGRPDWVKAAPEVLDLIIDAHNDAMLARHGGATLVAGAGLWALSKLEGER